MLIYPTPNHSGNLFLLLWKSGVGGYFVHEYQCVSVFQNTILHDLPRATERETSILGGTSKVQKYSPRFWRMFQFRAQLVKGSLNVLNTVFSEAYFFRKVFLGSVPSSSSLPWSSFGIRYRGRQLCGACPKLIEFAVHRTSAFRPIFPRCIPGYLRSRFLHLSILAQNHVRTCLAKSSLRRWTAASMFGTTGNAPSKPRPFIEAFADPTMTS